MYWYALFVLDGSEDEIVRQIGTMDKNGDFRPFAPKIASVFRSGRRAVKEYRTMFPGYVFLETERSPEETVRALKPFLDNSSLIIRMLKYGNEHEIALDRKDCELLNRLLDDRKCLEMSTGIIEGDRVFVESGPLVGMESTIKRIDRHKKTATIEFECMGRVQRVKVGLDIVRKVK